MFRTQSTPGAQCIYGFPPDWYDLGVGSQARQVHKVLEIRAAQVPLNVSNACGLLPCDAQ